MRELTYILLYAARTKLGLWNETAVKPAGKAAAAVATSCSRSQIRAS